MKHGDFTYKFRAGYALVLELKTSLGTTIVFIETFIYSTNSIRHHVYETVKGHDDSVIVKRRQSVTQFSAVVHYFKFLFWALKKDANMTGKLRHVLCRFRSTAELSVLQRIFQLEAILVYSRLSFNLYGIDFASLVHGETDFILMHLLILFHVYCTAEFVWLDA